jgi:hypothetical protein
MKRKKMHRDCVKQSVAVFQHPRPPWSARCDASPSTIYIKNADRSAQASNVNEPPLLSAFTLKRRECSVFCAQLIANQVKPVML